MDLMIKRAFLPVAFALIAGITALPAQAQNAEGTSSPDSAGWGTLPRDEWATTAPSASPTTKDCSKKACIYLVNLSNHRVTQFRYAIALKNGAPEWSGNQFPSNYDFYSKRWTMWYPPKEIGCRLDLDVVMIVDGKNHEESGTFDVCANPTLLFTIRDPFEKGKLGTVTVDPISPDTPTAPAKP
jgi:hypothetical protein